MCLVQWQHSQRNHLRQQVPQACLLFSTVLLDFSYYWKSSCLGLCLFIPVERNGYHNTPQTHSGSAHFLWPVLCYAGSFRYSNFTVDLNYNFFLISCLFRTEVRLTAENSSGFCCIYTIFFTLDNLWLWLEHFKIHLGIEKNWEEFVGYSELDGKMLDTFI